MSLVTLLLFWKFCHCNIFLSISITRPKITISYLLKPLCVWNSKISSEKDRVMLIHHIYFSHMPMAKFCHSNFCQGKESGLMLWIFFLIAIFILLQKNAFGHFFFQISCMGSKVPFWQKWKIAKMALPNPCMKFEKNFGQKHSFEAILKWH